MKYPMMTAALAAGLMLAAAPAWAQEGSSGTGMPPGASQSTMGRVDISALKPVDEKGGMDVTYNGLSVDNLKKASVYGANDEKIGGIDKVLADPQNKIVAVTVDAGGFLGIGSKEVVMPIDQLQYDSSKKQFNTSMNKEQVKSMPEWTKK